MPASLGGLIEFRLLVHLSCALFPFLITARGNVIVMCRKRCFISQLGMKLGSINDFMLIESNKSKNAVMSQLYFIAIINLSQPVALVSAKTHKVPVG